MSEVHEDVKIPAQPATVESHLVAHKCDLCGREARGNGYRDPNWLDPKTRGPDFSTTEVKLEFGYSYPGDGGEAQSREYHICTPCFTDKLEPWLHAQGAKPTCHKVDF